ncbi:MAG: hypothetical protein AXA67_05260 [Methylothermaceae bacteria B42]|nr:MAG: hypothetical protein AXA67_05260 [Methylothermaceae bacteria B42]HHJ39376.1 hypothetical protein [Methylothermaceae bacterium]
MPHNTIQGITTAAGAVLFISGLLISLLSIIDPAAILFFIFPLPLALLLLVRGQFRWLVLYLIFFVFSLGNGYWISKNHQNKMIETTKPFDHERFVKCSNQLFEKVSKHQKQLTGQQMAAFHHCLQIHN